MRATHRFFTRLLFLLFISNNVFAIQAAPFPFTETQPDGTEITLHTRGDEHFSWLEDTRGYTVVRNKGWFEYAKRGPSGRLLPNGMIVGRDNPKARGLQKRILPSAAIRAQSTRTINGVSTSEGIASGPELVPPTGSIKNLVVMIRFSDHTGRTLPSVSDVDVLFNNNGSHALAPTGSLKDVYFENSYGQMTLNSFVNPGVGDWITVTETETYYANGVSSDQTLWEALREALDTLDTYVNFNDYDTDNDGYIDSIAFIHSGYGAETTGGNDCYGTAQADRIWSHRWAIQPSWVSSEGVRVFDYHISPGVWGTCGSDIGRIGVIAHETGHFFGLPDLYDTDSGGSGIGSWGLMANSWDFNFTQLCPPHFSPWSKIDLGWYSPTVITEPGEYAINQAETNAEVYRINTGYPSGEYLLIENRQNAGFDCTIPQGGLAIWHIDDAAGYNTEGYPGQPGWPGNGNHYRVALLQADGNYQMEKGINRGDSGDTHHAAGVDAIAPGPAIHPNTDAYQGGTIIDTGITISDISASAANMTFCYNGCTVDPPADPSALSATAISDSQIDLVWTDNSTNELAFDIERSPDGSGWSALISVGSDVTSWSDTGLSPETIYHYRVKASNNAGDSGYTNTASDTTGPLPPAAPTDLVATTITISSIDLGWTDVANNEDGYRVERSPNGTNGWTLEADLPADSTSYNDTVLNESTTYYYRVSAYRGISSSTYLSGNFTTLTAPPNGAPSSLSANAISSTQINLAWTDNANNETGFEIQRSVDGSDWGSLVPANVGANSTSYSDTGLAFDTPYHYRVRATNSVGDSAFSNTASASTLPPECSESKLIPAGQWIFFALPCTPPDASASKIFSSGAADIDYGTTWIIATWDTGVQDWVYLAANDVMVEGKGYILFSVNAFTGIVGGANNTGGAIPLAADASVGEWNLVGNPHTIDVNWIDVSVSDGSKPYNFADMDKLQGGTYYCEGSIHQKCIMWHVMNTYDAGYTPFDGSGPTPADQGMLTGFDAMWVLSFRATSITMPAPAAAPPAFVAASAAPANASKPDKKDKPKDTTGGTEWRVRLVAESSTMRDDGNWLGQLENAKDERDTNDLEEWTPFSSPYLSILFTNPLFDTVDWGYTRDYRALADQKTGEWPFVVRASSGVGEVTLSWKGDATLFEGALLVDEVSGESVMMLPGGTYSFEMSSDEHAFRVVF